MSGGTRSQFIGIRLIGHSLRASSFFIAFLAIIGWTNNSSVRIFLIGDSTMADKETMDNAERGWGQMLREFFDPSVTIENFARNGRSTKSFIDEGRWNTVYDELRAGDFVFIQFGHNDEKVTDTSRYAAAHSGYKQNLLRFVADCRAKSAIPVLLTPIQRRKFDDAGKLVSTHGDYPAVVREVAAEQHVDLIDLTSLTTELLSQLGPEKSKALFMWIDKGIFDSLPNGKEDNTHFTEYGAIQISQLVSNEIRKSSLALKTHLKLFSKDSLLGLNKVVALDYFYNCEWKFVGKERVQFHYIWEDTANSGFSQLGAVIGKLGAYITKVRHAPTQASLANFSLYIIVDPDTPSESEFPNYISDSSAADIAEWVKEGGVLVLMGNDKGNMEFEHLNRLANRFGLNFNEDSYHRVQGTEYDMGKFSNLPDHPIFRTVKQIYLKEICSLNIQPPAQPALSENGKVFMAISHYGKGIVFAVGDPWLYNEYIDSRRLSPEFENLKAGEQLFHWLLEQATTRFN